MELRDRCIIELLYGCGCAAGWMGLDVRGSASRVAGLTATLAAACWARAASAVSCQWAGRR
jgi:hypothetical protein